MTNEINPGAGVQGGTLISVQTVVAQNLARALNLQGTEAEVAAIELHIKDEMAAVQSHFAMAVADIQHSYTNALNEALSTFSFVKSNKVLVGAVTAAIFIVGAVFGHFV